VVGCITLEEALDLALEIEFSSAETIDAVARLDWRGEAGGSLLRLRAAALGELARARFHSA